jgi:DNA-binding response OmpR family regulator
MKNMKEEMHDVETLEVETISTPERKYKILLVEDDTNFGNVLKKYLEMNDFIVELARDGKLGLAAFIKEKYDLCLLDVMMPNMDGFQLAEEIRNVDIDVPLFFLTAKNMKEDILIGYQLGADDYILKPFDSEILLSKIKAIIKRNTELVDRQNGSGKYRIGNYIFDTHHGELLKGDEKIDLQPKACALLKVLAENKNVLVNRETLLKKVWGSDSYFNGRSMDVYIAKLRKHFKEDDSVEIKTHHGFGFRLIGEINKI